MFLDSRTTIKTSHRNLLGIDLRQDYRGALNIPVTSEELLKLDDVRQLETIFAAYKGVFDGYIDFPFYELVREYVHDHIDATQLNKKLQAHYDRVPTGLVLPALLDNHDVDRIMYSSGNRPDKVIEAVRLQFSQPHPKFIYYGTELGMTQSHADSADQSNFIDIYCRMPMPPLLERDLSNAIYTCYRSVLSKRSKT